ncbi:MAG: hypothetical protein [Arizlama microvirus]|nr:MAG: hypothetical protein [Arizlama microvirus]
MRRHKMSRRASRRSFRRGATRIHRKNVASPMRGGWRL